MADFIYMDDSNVYIEARHVAAVRHGMARTLKEAMDNKIFDNSYTVDFGKLYLYLAGDNAPEVKRCVLFGSRPPDNDSIWYEAEKAGFEVVVEDRNVKNKEKKIDTGIVTEIVRDAYRLGKPGEDLFVVVAGDMDFVPPVKRLREDGFDVEVVFWEHAAGELKRAASRFTSLDGHFDYLQLNH